MTSFTYTDLRTIKSGQSIWVYYGSRGTQKAQFVKWGRRHRTGTVFMHVMKWNARSKKWTNLTAIDLNEVASVEGYRTAKGNIVAAAGYILKPGK